MEHLQPLSGGVITFPVTKLNWKAWRGCVDTVCMWKHGGLFYVYKDTVICERVCISVRRLNVKCRTRTKGGTACLRSMYFLRSPATFIIYVSLFPSLCRSFSLTLYPSHLSVFALSSSHLAKVISCCIERYWHCDEYTKQCGGRAHKQQSSSELTSCTQTEEELKQNWGWGKTNPFGTQGRKQRKKTMVGLAAWSWY